MARAYRTTARNLTGLVFGSLTALTPTERRDGSSIVWRCRCVCGAIVEMSNNCLQAPYNHSCGCQRGTASVTHGETKRKQWTPEYVVWAGIISRCTNPKSKRFYQYGGRGITVCDRWRTYDHFRADMGPRPAGCTIDRKDNDLGYSPDNCRWATQKEQQRNRSNNRLLTWNGRTMCAAEWAEVTGLDPKRIIGRLHRGWSIERTLSTPTK